LKPVPQQLPERVIWDLSIGRRGYERETYEEGRELLPELPIFGWLRFHRTLTGALPPDRHLGAFEIHYMVRGHLRWWVEEEQFSFSTGQIFVIRPGELHGGDEGSLQPCEHYWLRIKFPASGALPSLTPAETEDLRRGFETLEYRTFPTSPTVKEFFDRLLEEHRHTKSRHALTMARALLHALLITVLREHDRYIEMAARRPLATWRVRRTLQWMEARIYNNDEPIDNVAKQVGLSPAGLRARFKTETGFTPHEYLHHRRIEEAQRRLAETADEVTAIAHELGFSSSQYFSTAFRRQTGLTPGEYRERHRPV
jgi:AraC-like DNA-binding protein